MNRRYIVANFFQILPIPLPIPKLDKMKQPFLHTGLPSYFNKKKKLFQLKWYKTINQIYELIIFEVIEATILRISDWKYPFVSKLNVTNFT